MYSRILHSFLKSMRLSWFFYPFLLYTVKFMLLTCLWFIKCPHMCDCVKMKWKSLSYISLFGTTWTVLYSPWNPLGQNTGVGSLSLLHGIFPQGLNPGLLHCKWFLYQLSHKGRLRGLPKTGKFLRTPDLPLEKSVCRSGSNS